MKTTGILIIVIGLLLAAFTTFTIMYEGMLNIKIHPLIWAPLIGAILVIIGVAINLIGRRNSARL